MAQVNAVEDSRDQRTVLDHLLDQYPALLRYSDLLTHLAGVSSSSDRGGQSESGIDGFSEFFLDPDAVKRAVRELLRNGAVYEKSGDDGDPWIIPTPTTVYLEQLPVL